MKPRKPVPRISAKKLQQLGGDRPRSTITAKPTPVKKKGAKQAKRQAKYKSYLSSAAWKKLRLAVFERDSFRCTGKPYVDARQERCGFVDWAGKGTGLVCDHLTYARFGHENLEDLRTLCKHCNERATVAERANWQRGWTFLTCGEDDQ